MSYHIGRQRRSNGVRPYYGMVTSSKRREPVRGNLEYRWHWHVRRYEDNSTACRGPGAGFATEVEAVKDMTRFLHRVSEITVDVRDQ